MSQNINSTMFSQHSQVQADTQDNFKSLLYGTGALGFLYNMEQGEEDLKCAEEEEEAEAIQTEIPCAVASINDAIFFSKKSLNRFAPHKNKGALETSFRIVKVN